VRLLASVLTAGLLCTSVAIAQSADPAAAAAEAKLKACAPKVLDEALACLDSSLYAPVKAELLAKPYDELFAYHFGLGSWIRNEWRLWGGSSLHDDMRKRGFGHPDAMSREIIQLFWLDQHGCTQARQQQAAYWKAFSEEADLSAASSPDGMPVYEDIKVQAPHLDCTTPAEATAQ
jgi:hypothetical protein